jgi:hypothetical protein
MPNAQGSGEGEEFDGTLSDFLMIVAFTSVSFYNVGEITLLIFNTFRRYKGIYFWSMIAATWGIFFHNFGFLTKFFDIIKNDYINIVFVTIGWYGMVTGQSLVLWSRLHIVVCCQPRLIRGILIMIITNAILFHLPTTVMTFGSNSPKERYFLRAYNYMEKIQMTVFFVQECIISTVYLYFIVRLVRDNTKSATRRILHHAFFVNALVIALDIALLGTEFANLYHIETTFKGMTYSIKLKAEFLILNRLRAHLLENDHSQVTEGGHSLQPATSFHGVATGHMPPMKISVQKDTHVAVDRNADQVKFDLDDTSDISPHRSVVLHKISDEERADVKITQ